MGEQAKSAPEVRVDVHQNAKLTPRGREQMVRYVLDRGASYRAAARAYGVDVKTVKRWVVRFEREGEVGLQDRSCRPHRSPGRVPRHVRRRLCRQRRKERLTMDELAREEGISRATVARVRTQAGLSRLSELEPKPPVIRHEHAEPGSMVHLDIEKLGRFRVPGHRVTGRRTKASAGVG